MSQSDSKTSSVDSGARARRLAALSLASLGIVYGDIGTSPLYAVRACFYGRYGVAPTDGNVLGVLSLVAWSLIVVISIKYLAFILRADHDGEGGILALMELVRRKTRGHLQRFVLIVGLFGAALLYGDGMITPAISVLSAIEGIEVATPVFAQYVVPLTIAVLVVLFLVQRIGTGGVGMLFGPVMVLWFAVLAVSGIASIAGNPSVLFAVDPRHALSFLVTHGHVGVTILGIVFLVVTGGEALYADIGHFGTAPIRIGWYSLVLPGLLINYFGQGALILARGADLSNPFYELMPNWALYPSVVLATFATVIASQAIISGAFSLTFQGFHLGYLPRLRIRHTSSRQRGQIYIPEVNWILLVATVGLVIGFRRSGNLAAAYGVAISMTMVITSVLFYIAMRRVFEWPRRIAIPLTAVFLVIDSVYFYANIQKFLDGGWFPLVVGALVFLVMMTWRKGMAIERRNVRNRAAPVREYLLDIGGGGAYRRVPGQAVYLTQNPHGTPHALRRNLEHNRSLHRTVVIYTALNVRSPRVHEAERLEVEKLRGDIFRVVSRYGFMETPDVPRDLDEANRREGLGLDLDTITYFTGGEILLPKDGAGMDRLRSWLYALMARNERRTTHYFNLPPAQVVEIGTHIQV